MRFALPVLHGVAAIVAWGAVTLILLFALLGFTWFVMTVAYDLKELARDRVMREALRGLPDDDEDEQGESKNERRTT